MAKTAKQKIIDALEDKGLIIQGISFQPMGRSLEMCGPLGGWEIWIDETASPLRGADNPIVGYNYKEILEQIQLAYKGYDFCPVCGHGIEHREEQNMFCENCRTDFSEIVEKERN